ncbi:MAG: gluconokinase [Nitratireductor sp.]
MSMAELQPLCKQTRLFVVMGVAGCGKSTIGATLAKHLSGTYIDGDDFHPQANIDKMSKGEALQDADRWPWLEIVAKELANIKGLSFVGCSALKKSYRDFITQKAGEPVCFIYLDGSKELIANRMAKREGHFMPTSLLDSQFAALQVPSKDEHKIAIDISGSQESVIDKIVSRLNEPLSKEIL